MLLKVALNTINQTKPNLKSNFIYSWLSLSRIRLTRISGWVEFLSKSRTSLCINIYNLAGVVGRQSALHKENSGFATPTLGRHISTFRGYHILFSIRNPYINRFTNHFQLTCVSYCHHLASVVRL
jgi:hypothetical protein